MFLKKDRTDFFPCRMKPFITHLKGIPNRDSSDFDLSFNLTSFLFIILIFCSSC